jgi:hypothetical protein
VHVHVSTMPAYRKGGRSTHILPDRYGLELSAVSVTTVFQKLWLLRVLYVTPLSNFAHGLAVDTAPYDCI